MGPKRHFSRSAVEEQTQAWSASSAPVATGPQPEPLFNLSSIAAETPISNKWKRSKIGEPQERAGAGRSPILRFSSTWPQPRLLAAYALTLFTAHTGHIWSLIDNQVVVAFEVVLALGCLARARTRRPGRSVALVLGLGLLAWALGDIVWTLESSPSTPSLADGFYLVFYPLASLALVLLVRSQVKHIRPGTWLDAAMAGLGAAAICAFFASNTILDSIRGSAASVTVNLAYPIGDLILLALAIGAVTIVPRHPARLLVFAAGCVLMAIGDTVYLNQSSAGTYHVGTLLDLTWPAAMLVLSGSVWLRSSRSAARSCSSSGLQGRSSWGLSPWPAS